VGLIARLHPSDGVAILLAMKSDTFEDSFEPWHDMPAAHGESQVSS
jgi:hypothetical protein